MSTVTLSQALTFVREAVEPVVRLESLGPTELEGRIVAERTEFGGRVLEIGTRLDPMDVADLSKCDGPEVMVFSRPKMVVLTSKADVRMGCDLWMDPGLEMLSKLSRCRGMVPLLEEYRPGCCTQVMSDNIGADMVVILPRDQMEHDEAKQFCIENGTVLFDDVVGLNGDTTFAIVGPTPFTILPSDRFEMVRSALVLLYDMAGRMSRYAAAPGDVIMVQMAQTVDGGDQLVMARIDQDVAWPLLGEGLEQKLKKMDGFIVSGPDEQLLEGSIVSFRRFRI